MASLGWKSRIGYSLFANKIMSITNYNGDNYAISKAVNIVGREVVDKLEEFYVESSKLENNYKQYALTLIDAVLKINRSGDTKKQLTTLLLDLGFKNSNVSKMLGHQERINQLERDKATAAADALKQLPVSTGYVLATCSDDTFNQIWTKDWDFGNNTLTQKQVEQLKTKYEKPQKFPHGNSRPDPSPLEKARKLLTDYPDILELIDQHLAEE